MAKKRENKFLSFIVVVIIIIFAAAIYMVVSSGNLYKNTPDIQPTSNQIYKSKAMKFSIDVPSDFQVEENLPTITVKNAKGVIYIDRSGTNFETLEEHLNNLSRLNHFVISSKENVSINSLPAVKGIIDGKMHYFIYAKPWTVYSIFTSSQALFSDLDKIAQSFKYTP